MLVADSNQRRGSVSSKLTCPGAAQRLSRGLNTLRCGMSGVRNKSMHKSPQINYHVGLQVACAPRHARQFTAQSHRLIQLTCTQLFSFKRSIHTHQPPIHHPRSQIKSHLCDIAICPPQIATNRPLHQNANASTKKPKPAKKKSNPSCLTNGLRLSTKLKSRYLFPATLNPKT